MSSLIPWTTTPYFGGDMLDPFDLAFGGTTARWPVASSGRRRGSEDDPASLLAHTNVDWRETDDAHIFRADLPGVKKEEVKVQVEDGNMLQISREHTKEEQEDKDDKWHRRERRYGSFMRKFRLPENSNLDEIKCTMENGILTVVVPKKESEQKEKNVRAIDIRTVKLIRVPTVLVL